MGIFDRKQKKAKKKASKGKFERIEVDGKMLPIRSFYLFKNNADGKKYIELTAMEPVPELHFSEIDMNVFLSDKKLSINTSFVDAFSKGKAKIYKFSVNSSNVYYI